MAGHPSKVPAPLAGEALLRRFREVRAATERLIEPLAPEDMVPQSMPDASPTKWHLAHTTWFFEALVLRALDPPQAWHDPAFPVLFNSYYNALGEQFSRPHRGLVTRPTVAEVLAYRRQVDERIAGLLGGDDPRLEALAPVVTLGLHHEQQHQELILTDVKHLLAQNPTFPVYRPRVAAPGGEAAPLAWQPFAEGVREVGFAGTGFAYDNEGPRHRVFLEAFALASRPVTCGEYLEFMSDGGYRRAELWLSEGWAKVQEEGWRAPLYWLERDGGWEQFTLAGVQPVNPAEPVCHVSLLEADAYARWAGARLPTEHEWEVAAATAPVLGGFVENGLLHPSQAPSRAGLVGLFGDVWEWTSSAYAPYPGYRPAPGALGEYNGKFMCNQYVLRGGSCATPASHVRATYRNFWPAATRFQFTGIRLARDLD